MLTPETAYNRAAARCATAEYCAADWQRKLAAKGLSAADVSAVIARLIDEGYIDDARYARAYVHDKAAYERWGPQKIRQGLRAKGVDQHLIDDAIEAVDDTLWRDKLAELLRRKAATLADADDYTRRQKLARFAAGRGYTPDLVFGMIDLTD